MLSRISSIISMRLVMGLRRGTSTSVHCQPSSMISSLGGVPPSDRAFKPSCSPVRKQCSYSPECRQCSCTPVCKHCSCSPVCRQCSTCCHAECKQTSVKIWSSGKGAFPQNWSDACSSQRSGVKHVEIANIHKCCLLEPPHKTKEHCLLAMRGCVIIQCLQIGSNGMSTVLWFHMYAILLC